MKTFKQFLNENNYEDQHLKFGYERNKDFDTNKIKSANQVHFVYDDEPVGIEKWNKKDGYWELSDSPYGPLKRMPEEKFINHIESRKKDKYQEGLFVKAF